jgi:glucose-1-phosphate thymidylyltransferase
MKLIVLAGGSGTRLGNLTTAVNKHLLPVGTEPMIAHSAKLGAALHFEHALYITSTMALTPIASLLTTNYCVPKPYFAIQNAPSGIADAILLGREYSDADNIMVLLGDNIFEQPDIRDFKVAINTFNGGCTIWAKSVENPSDYGVLDREKSRIIEKPVDPPSSLAITGIYLFDNTVWDRIVKLKPSIRGELEISELINTYMRDGNCHVRHLTAPWNDCGKSAVDYLRLSINYINL